MRWNASLPAAARSLGLAGLVAALLVAAPWPNEPAVARGLGQATPPPQQPPARQMPPVTFKVEINYVEVDAIVVDKQGTFVPNLRKEDFQVLEDGKAQTIANFSLIDIPVEHAEAPLFVTRPIEPDVQSNVHAYDGRIYLIVLDDLHTAMERTARVKQAARRFIEQTMSDNDIAAVVTTSGRTDAAQDFTRNRRLLLRAVDHFMGKKLRSPTLNKLDEYNRTRDYRSAGDPIKDPEEQERAYNARTMLDGLRQMSDYLAAIHGRRKALVLVSEGIDYNINDVINNTEASSLLQDVRDLIAAASRSNVAIYAVDPRGLTDMGSDAIEMGAPADDPSLRLGTEGLMDELRLSHDSLRTVSEETGGFAAINRNDYASAFERIRSENSSYYVLGYYPANDRRDGRFRTIQVKLNRPGLEVRARKGYMAPRGKAPSTKPVETTEGTSAELREALGNPLPVSGIPLTVSVAPFKATIPNASVVVTIQGGAEGLKFTEKDGKFDDTIETSIIAIDHNGKIRGGDRQSLNMALRPQTRTLVEQAGYRMISRLELPPGHYQVRVGARESGGGNLGTVHFDLDVPDFSKDPLAMSGLVLSSARAGVVVTPRQDEDLKKLLPGPPTTARVFVQGDELAVLAEVYDNASGSLHKVDVQTTLQGDDGRAVFKHEEARSNSEFEGARGGYGYLVRIPLKDVRPGLYLLKVEAHMRAGKEPTVSREVQIRVVTLQ